MNKLVVFVFITCGCIMTSDIYMIININSIFNNIDLTTLRKQTASMESWVLISDSVSIDTDQYQLFCRRIISHEYKKLPFYELYKLLPREDLSMGEFKLTRKGININMYVTFSKANIPIDYLCFPFTKNISPRNIKFYTNTSYLNNLIIIDILDTSKYVLHPSYAEIIDNDKWKINNEGFFIKSNH